MSPLSPLPSKVRPPRHVSEDLLEAYAMGKPLGEHSQRVHVHLLVCDKCCLRLMREVEIIDALRRALRELVERELVERDADYRSPAEASSSSRKPIASKKALRTSVGCPS
jgi:hypothetical protein